MKKIAFLIQASNNEPAKALHGLLYAQELHEAGHEVTVIFAVMAQKVRELAE